MTLDELIRDIPQQLALLHQEIRQLRGQLENMQEQERLSYNLHEAAARTGLGYDALYRRFKAGTLQCTQDGPGGAIVVTREELRRFITAQDNDVVAVEKEVLAVARRAERKNRIKH